MQTISIQTNKNEEFLNITDRIQQEVSQSRVGSGLVHVFVPHTTAALTINENADPDVVDDILKGLNSFVPASGFKHYEGNSPAHIKSSLCGVSLTIAVAKGELVLGTWQGIYFCEFDGPRSRTVNVTLRDCD